MLKKLYPKAFISSLAEIDPGYFKEKGIKGLILDLDNTIIPWKAGDIEPVTVELLRSFKNSGIGLCVVSNAMEGRVKNLLGPLGIPWVSKAAKPRRKPFIKAMQIMGTNPHETAVVGDQIFTDILGGNRLRMFSVLVVPMSKKEFIGTKLVRIVEKLVLLRLARKGAVDVPERIRK